MKEKLVESSQHRYTKGKLCLTNLVASYSKTTWFMDRTEEMDVVYFNYKAFNTVSHILVPK